MLVLDSYSIPALYIPVSIWDKVGHPSFRALGGSAPKPHWLVNWLDRVGKVSTPFKSAASDGAWALLDFTVPCCTFRLLSGWPKWSLEHRERVGSRFWRRSAAHFSVMEETGGFSGEKLVRRFR